MSSVHIQIEQFEGPLGLLLHLIRKEEMDIFDINIHQITRQYLDYIKAMKKLDLEVAGNFVAMAATMIQIKSRMLLPTYNEEGEEVEMEDPRKELVRKLIEYQKFQEAGQRLYERPLLGRDIWKRGVRLKVESDLEDEVIIEEENVLFALIKAYRHAIKNMRTGLHTVVKSMQSISERIREIKHLLIVGRQVNMHDLIHIDAKKDVDTILITFLSMLELAKVGVVSLFQSGNFEDLYVQAKNDIVDDAISRVEDYDDGSAGGVKAEALFAEAESSAAEAEMISESIEDKQLDLGQKLSFLDEPESEESASDEEIFAEELRLAEEEKAKVLGSESVPEEVGHLDLSVHESSVEDEFDGSLVNTNLMSDDQMNQEETIFTRGASEEIDLEINDISVDATEPTVIKDEKHIKGQEHE